MYRSTQHYTQQEFSYVFRLIMLSHCQTQLEEYKTGYTLQAFFRFHVKWVPVTTAWRVLRLRMEERPPVIEGSCEYTK
jgi:hypothetical protein